MKPIFFNNIEFKEIVEKVKELVQESENLPNKEVREHVELLLKYFDLMHREPLARIIETIERSHPELGDSLKQDYTVQTLLELYDFQNEKTKD